MLLAFQVACHGPAAKPESAVLEDARQAFLDARFSEAEGAYQRYLQEFPNGSSRLEAWQRLADISQMLRNSPKNAATLLETALLEFGHDPKAAPGLIERAAQLRFGLRDYAKASALYRTLLAFPGADADHLVTASLELARTRVLAHDPAGALAAYATCRQRPLGRGDRDRCALAQAQLLLRLDRGSEAQPILQALFGDRATPPPVRAEAGFALGQRSEDGHDKAAAKVYYETIRDIYPNPLVIEQKLKALQKP